MESRKCLLVLVWFGSVSALCLVEESKRMKNNLSQNVHFTLIHQKNIDFY
jgi:hypothetical protein